MRQTMEYLGPAHLALVSNEHPRLGADDDIPALAELVDGSNLLQRAPRNLPEPRSTQPPDVHARAVPWGKGRKRSPR